MLVVPRLYALAQTPDKDSQHVSPHLALSLTGWSHRARDYRRAATMLLLHQTGSLRVGEVVR